MRTISLVDEACGAGRCNFAQVERKSLALCHENMGICDSAVVDS